MKKIYEFFENMNEFVYVSDMDNYDLVYMNKKARETYGFNSPEELVGKKCYQVLQGNSAPCMLCGREGLTVGAFKEWSYYNPVIEKHLLVKDSVIEEDGRKYLIELDLDVSAQERQGRELRGYQDLEKLANEAFRIALQAPTPDKSIDVLLEYLGKALKGERTYVFERNENGCDDNTYEWVANGVTPEIDNLQNLPAEICANWYQKFSENKKILIEDLEDIKEEDPLQYENLYRQNIHSLTVVPLYDAGKIIGFYGVDNPPGESMDYAQNMLEIVGHFIVSCLKRRNLLKELQKMSYCDQLTGIGNRHALYEYIEDMELNESVGVVYCDITSLKKVNDQQGHAAGDRLIYRACQCLKDSFAGYGLFRMGGDEFLAICPQIDEDELGDKINDLRESTNKNDVIMAVGFVWKDKGHGKLEKLLTEAESMMYDDKAAYYKRMGIDRRR
ncbi:MAG: diguanylate cyclase [Agathobacter sp.]|nr:diguanylate cyclase [Agathobacter sp.]